MHFFLLYDRAAGRLLQPEQAFEDRAGAMQARFAAERRHAGDTNVEAVVFDAASIEALRRTHARYFMSLSELAGRDAADAHGAGRSAPTPGRFPLSSRATD